MFTISMLAFHYIFMPDIYLFSPLSQRSLKISELLRTARSTSKSWWLGPWYKYQRTNMVHQDHFDFSFLSTRCSFENITEYGGWRYDTQGRRERIFKKSERRVARVHSIRESWLSSNMTVLITENLLGHCDAKCERGFSWNTTRRNPTWRWLFKLPIH